MGRRWDARGTSRGGPEGRRPGTPVQRPASAVRISGGEQRQPSAAAISIPTPRTSRVHPRCRDHRRTGQPLALTGACRARHCAYDALPACIPAPHNADAGLPPRNTAPVRLSTPRARPPASHRRGRSSPIILRATAPMGRRWAVRGTSRGGPEGRRTGTPVQRSTSATSDQHQRTAAGISGSLQLSRTSGRDAKPTPMPPRGALFMVTSEWFEESDSRSGIRFQGRDESPHGDP